MQVALIIQMHLLMVAVAAVVRLPWVLPEQALLMVMAARVRRAA
jgi:hypothetical protein